MKNTRTVVIGEGTETPLTLSVQDSSGTIGVNTDLTLTMTACKEL